MNMLNLKKKRKRMCFLTIFFFVCFILMFMYYFSKISGCTYLGIRAQKQGQDWIIKNIQDDGSAKETILEAGDKILTIDGEVSTENNLMNKWLVVEQAEKITVLHNNTVEEICFAKSSSGIQKHIIFSLIGLSGFCFLFYYVRRQNSGYSGEIFYSFILLVIFSLVSIVPSSMGVFLGRLIVILFVSLCPFYLDLFLKTHKVSGMYEGSKFYILELGIVLVNIVLCILILFIKMPYVLLEYLAQGIFGVWGILLIVVFIKNRWQGRENENLRVSHINLSLISIFSFLPLFLFYVFPVQWRAPFFLLIPFTLLPIVGVFHLLIISKLIAHRYKFKKNNLYFMLAGLFTFIIIIIALLSEYIPVYILAVYCFCLITSLMPFLEEVLFAIKRKIEQINSLQLFSAVEEERENISIFIHDTVIQDTIYSMKRIEMLEDVLNKQEILQILDEIVFCLRELCSDIYPLMIQEMGLKNALLAMISQTEKKHPVSIHTNIRMRELKFSSKKSNFILRSIKELINNSILHGNATYILLTITNDDKYCFFSVSDNGKFVNDNILRASHFGLNVIKEKLSLLNGELIIDVAQGTIITIKIPIDKEGEKTNDENSIN